MCQEIDFVKSLGRRHSECGWTKPNLDAAHTGADAIMKVRATPHESAMMSCSESPVTICSGVFSALKIALIR